VKHVPLNVAEGLEVIETPAPEFDSEYSQLTGYPPERAVKLYLGFAQTIGASVEVLNHFKGLVPVTEKEYQMATQAKEKVAVKKAPGPVVKAAAAKASKAEKPAAKPVKAANQPKAAAAGEPSGRVSAASMFKELILEGRLTDEQIFAKVQKAFNLDDKKKTYVAWYRKDLIKKGALPAPK
jgi:hypothetical protein